MVGAFFLQRTNIMPKATVAKGQNIEEKVGGVGTKLEGKVGENCKNGASDLCRWNLRNESLGNGK